MDVSWELCAVKLRTTDPVFRSHCCMTKNESMRLSVSEEGTDYRFSIPACAEETLLSIIHGHGRNGALVLRKDMHCLARLVPDCEQVDMPSLGGVSYVWLREFNTYIRSR